VMLDSEMLDSATGTDAVSDIEFDVTVTPKILIGKYQYVFF